MFVTDLLQFLREDSATVPRIIFISISGFGGIIAGYRGSNTRFFAMLCSNTYLTC